VRQVIDPHILEQNRQTQVTFLSRIEELEADCHFFIGAGGIVLSEEHLFLFRRVLEIATTAVGASLHVLPIVQKILTVFHKEMNVISWSAQESLDLQAIFRVAKEMHRSRAQSMDELIARVHTEEGDYALS
jgi:hypothetical protein